MSSPLIKPDQPPRKASSRLMEGLTRLSQVINAFPNPHQTLAEGLKIVAETLRVEKCILYKYNPLTYCLEPLYPAFGLTDNELTFFKIRIAGPGPFTERTSSFWPFASAFLKGVPAFQNKSLSFSGSPETPFSPVAIRNSLIVPVQIEGEVQGLCVVLDKIGEKFNSQDLEGLVVMAGFLSTLIKNLTLLSQLEGSQKRQGKVVSEIITLKNIHPVKALNKELRQQIQQQQSLLGIINALNGSSKITEIYQIALAELAKSIKFDLGLIHGIKADQDLELMVIREVKGSLQPSLEVIAEEVISENFKNLIFTEDPSFPNPVALPVWENSEETNLQPWELQAWPGQNESAEMVQNGQAYNERVLPPLKTHNCNALSQNEPYLATNLPESPLCEVVKGFEGIQSQLCIPIKTEGRIFGVLHLANYRPHSFGGNDFALVLSICKQIAVAAERAHLFEQVDLLARTDALTQLYNKREFWIRIEQEISRAERQGRPLSLMIIDVDRLKWFNDLYGHSQGDILLARLGDLIREKCRNTDIGFRYGGDELCVILPDTGAQDAYLVAERIRLAAFEIEAGPQDEVVIGVSGQNKVSTSIGLAVYPDHGTTPAALFENADSAMYRAKETGKNRSVIFDEAVDANKVNFRIRIRPAEYQDNRLSLPLENLDSPNLAALNPSSNGKAPPEAPNDFSTPAQLEKVHQQEKLAINGGFSLGEELSSSEIVKAKPQPTNDFREEKI